MEWQCIGHNPTVWALGTHEGDQLIHIVARVVRLSNGEWGWNDFERGFGIEPSRELAIESASKAVGVVTPGVTPATNERI